MWRVCGWCLSRSRTVSPSTTAVDIEQDRIGAQSVREGKAAVPRGERPPALNPFSRAMSSAPLRLRIVPLTIEDHPIIKLNPFAIVGELIRRKRLERAKSSTDRLSARVVKFVLGIERSSTTMWASAPR